MPHAGRYARDRKSKHRKKQLLLDTPSNPNFKPTDVSLKVSNKKKLQLNERSDADLLKSKGDSVR